MQTRDGDAWTTVAEVTGNHRRRRVIDVPELRTDAVRVVVAATNGAPRAHVVAFRAYDTAGG